MSKMFKVVKIINEYKIVISAGSKDGITTSQKLEVFVPGEELFDPETEESLGTLDFIKCYLETKDVFDKMSICTNQETTASALGSFSSMFMGQSSKFTVDPSEITGGLNGSSVIKIGDLVRVSRA